MMKKIILTGKYIQLEALQASHYEVLKKLSQDERISTYSPALKLKFEAWFKKALQNENQLSFIVKQILNNEIVGSTRFYDIHQDHQRLTIGYTWYIPEVWGTVVNLESKKLLFEYAFNVLHMNRIEFFIDARNLRSRNAVNKLGATEEGVLREHIHLEDGYIRDTVVYSILKKEWPELSLVLDERISARVA